MKFFVLPALSIAIIMAHVGISAAYSASTYLGGGCAQGTNVQPEFQVTAFNLTAGHSGCIAPVIGVAGETSWAGFSIVGCTSPGITKLFNDASCSAAVATFSGNVACGDQAFLSFTVTGC